jgi:formylglycine-generating enzyme required for sulfatase activity
MRNGALFIAAALASVSLAAVPCAFADEPNPYDPRPAPDDVAMPMPCGGTMVFRKVATSNYQGDLLKALLIDRRIVLGSPDPGTAYAEYSRPGYVAGAFAEKEKAKAESNAWTRYFLLGKYEVSKAQYDAVMSEGTNCPKPDFDSALPVTSVSWFDAVEFTRHYSGWLYKNAFDKLPEILGTPGFVRLPTETEWEFAERGGLAVPANEFQKRVPSPDGQQLQGYAWFAGQASADGQLQPIGSTQYPNPLGFYDMLGNASEMVLDPFHLIRGTREHGLVGGFVAKGGSFETPQGEMRSSMREELSYFNARTKSEAKGRQMGFRVAMADVALPDLRSINALREDWNAERQVVTTDPTGDPLLQLSKLAKDQADPELKRALDTIQVGLTKKSADSKEATDSANEANILAVVSMQESLGGMLRQYNDLANLESFYRNGLSNVNPAVAKGDTVEIDRLGKEKDQIAGNFLRMAEGYLVVLTQLAERYEAGPEGAAQVMDQIRLIYAELIDQNRKGRATVALDLLKVLDALHKTGDRAKPKMLEDVFGPLNFYQSK